MNERIKELADKATSYCDTLDIADQTIYQNIWKREFAELIIKECMEWCDAYATIDGSAQQIRDAIKKDFGVEE